MDFKRMSVEEIKQNLTDKLKSNFGCEVVDATKEQLYKAVALTVRDEIMQRRTESRGVRKGTGSKKVYYLSAEFLIGRSLFSNMVNLVNEKNYAQALQELGLDKGMIYEEEPEPGLGNGGLGRLAACFLDSLSSLELPAMGCTIRYEYGLFRQKLVDGYQVEVPDNWLDEGNIWEIPRPNDTVEVRFGGRVEQYEEDGRMCFRTVDDVMVEAVPYDIPTVGYDSCMVNMLRTWSARSPKRIDMPSFNRGQYVQAMEERELAEVISKVLYPNDDSWQGKELRLKQQYFFSSASVQYAVNDFLKVYGPQWNLFADKVAIHINDTHPAVAIPELMRILMDNHGLDWDEAEEICYNTFAYTNHTVLSEALEKWPENLFQQTLPRVYMILQEMNKRLCDKLWNAYPYQWDRIGKMAILAYNKVHMANLCVAYTHSVNGVSGIHTDILKKDTFNDYYMMEPNKFVAITNGITHRRWLIQSNPGLSDLIDSAIGDAWRKDMNRLSDLIPYADDKAFREKFAEVKFYNKLRLTDRVRRMQGIAIDPESMFDAQAKRLHEYKRQLMNALGILMLYNKIDEDPNFSIPPKTFIFGAKAAPGYQRAKLTIKLINAIADLIRKHPRASKMINVVFLENYCVSAAEVLMPAAEVSEQISTAGKEASGTGNMKFMMNGAITIGTMDGANCEIYDCVGSDNIYIFGMRADEVERSYASYRSFEIFETNAAIRKVLNQLIDGTFSRSGSNFWGIHDALLRSNDEYFVLGDFDPYVKTWEDMDRMYRDKERWQRMSLANIANSAFFSSDRTISEYAEEIWRV